METIELLKAMQEKCLRGGKYDDPLRIDKYKALEEAIKALENQPKYEKALAEMTKYFRCSKLKGLYSSEEDCHKYKSCEDCMIKYFKKQVGLKVSP